MLIATQKYDCATATSDVIRYFYDTNGEAYGFTYNGETYLYVKNLQGDVIGIISAEDNLLCLGLTYDPWGNVTYQTDEEAGEYELQIANEIAAINNIAYRGYFYDSETGLYYLQSRYYDPQVGRFINADDTAFIGYDGTPISTNIFVYCCNDPINYADYFGLWKTPFYSPNYSPQTPILKPGPNDYVYTKTAPTASDFSLKRNAIIAALSVATIIPNGSKFFLNFLADTGKPIKYDYSVAIKGDSTIRKKIYTEFSRIAKCAETYGKKSNYWLCRYDYYSTDCSSLDWQFAINRHYVYLMAQVFYDEKSNMYTANTIIFAYDYYNFSKTTEFIPFKSIPILKKLKITTKKCGRLVEVGLGSDFYSYGYAQYAVKWYRGSYDSTYFFKNNT